MTIAQTTPPALEPISLSEAKAFLRVDHTADDALIAALIKAAREFLETTISQSLMTQTWRQYESGLPQSREISAGVRPVQSLAAVTVFGADGTPRVLSEQEASILSPGHDARLRFHGTLAASDAMNGIEIDWVVGWGDTSVAVPAALRHAIQLLVVHWYEFRGAVAASQQPVSLPPGFDALVRPYRRVHV
ncbi:MAG: head-tail connector protein [Pseudomonadota bacterium]